MTELKLTWQRLAMAIVWSLAGLLALILGAELIERGGNRFATTLARIPLFLTERRVSRIEGGSFVASYLIYLLYLVIARV